MSVNSATSTPDVIVNSTPAAAAAASQTVSADTFLKLLVAQMQNQDPLNPMDNAQVTSQMAQINTVTGIEKLNTSVNGLSNSFLSMQALQGAALVGHNVIVKGNALAISDKVGAGGFDLAGAADSVKVEIMDSSGKVVDTQQLGALPEGKSGFVWDATDAADDSYTFKVTATKSGSPVGTTLLMRDTVNAITTGGSSFTLELAKSGSTPYADIQAIN
jgi:flagellar basal-body rod modification protein FlgD